MKIIIVGCGKVGETLAAELNEVGNSIVVVDQNAEKVRAIANKYDLMGVIGNGATRATQREAGVDGADLLIAVTGSDELNLLCCVMAKRAGGCQTIARVKSPEYASDAPYLKDELGLAMVINPEFAAAKEIARVLNFPTAIKIETFAKGRAELLKFKLPEGSPLIGMSVREAVIKYRANLLFCVVERENEAYIPNGDFVFSERDLVSVVAEPKMAIDFFKKIKFNLQTVKNAIILGGKTTTHYLCELLSRSGISIKIIEKDRALCEDLAARFDNTVVINANPSDESTLIEEGMATADAFVTLTGLDEENIILSLLAKNSGARKIITKINRMEYVEVIKNLELDSIVYPKNITADMILRFVRATKNKRGSAMKTLYSLAKGELEAAEFEVSDGSPIVGKPLSALELRPGVLIAAVFRGKTSIIPRGDTVIEKGDSVVIVTKALAITDVSDILI